jgi:hypothetical protein
MPGKVSKNPKALKNNWILATNPSNHNQCACFFIQLPNIKWISISKYKTSPDCTQLIPSCRQYFNTHPNALIEVHNGKQYAVASVRKKFQQAKKMGMMKKKKS